MGAVNVLMKYFTQLFFHFSNRLDRPAATIQPNKSNENVKRKRRALSNTLPDTHEMNKYTYQPAPVDSHKVVLSTPTLDTVMKKNGSVPRVPTVPSVPKKDINRTKSKENPYFKALVYENRELFIPNLGHYKDYKIEVSSLDILFSWFFSRPTVSKYYQGVKQFGSRSGLTFCQAWYGSELFARASVTTCMPLFDCFKILLGCQTVWIQIRPDVLSGLIWAQTVCKGISRRLKSLLAVKVLSWGFSLIKFGSNRPYFKMQNTLLSADKVRGYSFGVVNPFCPYIRKFCPSGTISHYLLVRFDAFLAYMISTMDSISYKFHQKRLLNTWVIALVLV